MTTETTNFKELFRRALAKVNELKAELAARDAASNEPIAIVGMACRLPGGGDDPQSFWRALLQGADTVRRLPENRWLAEALGSGAPEAKWASTLDAIESFDAAFFGISPREASRLDPQQRLLLEVAWEALENAGQPAAALVGSRTGVFIGMWGNDYNSLMRANGITDAYSGTGCLHSTAAGRISYVLGLQGPCMAVDTACSSSLVTVHLACQSLRLRESDMTLAGGVNLVLDPTGMTGAADMRAISPDGHCKSFDARANGYVRGEGCGLLVLKRLSDAQGDGDLILGLILSSAVNQDGRSTGLTVPNVLAQQALIREALYKAKVDASDIGYVETHGTGTSLGDPIEFEALRGALGAPRPNGAPCVLGAVKTNIGHIETAAGVTGMIKAVLCLNHEEIPKNLHFETLNPRISLEGTPFVIPTENMKWPATEKPRRAGVSAFGVGGTNAHVILQEAPKSEDSAAADAEQSHVLPLSAKTSAALEALVQAYVDHLEKTAEPLRDIAYTAACRRSHLEHRVAVVGQDIGEIAAALKEFAARKSSARVQKGKAQSPAPQVALVFSGQGAQWVGMGQELLQQSPRFRQAVEACEQEIQKAGGGSVIAELLKPEGASQLHRTEIAQPALFAIQVGLLAELREHGVEPALVIGHSVGEVAAAYAAGMLDLETACRVVVARALGMKDQAGRGKMFAVELAEAEALAALQGESPEVGIAAINGPRSVVLAGETRALENVIDKLQKAGTGVRELRVDYAFHSPQMQEAGETFLRAVGDIVATRGSARMISTVTGEELKASDCNAAYWARNIQQPVRFAQAVAEAANVGGRIFVEVGPHPVLSAELAEQLSSVGYQGKPIPTLRRNQGGRAQVQGALSALHVQGVAVNWAASFTSPGRVVLLPNYPWQRERHFVDNPRPQTKQQGVASQYYDAVTKLVEAVAGQADNHGEDKHNLFLTFAPLPETMPGFSWMKMFARPQDHLDQVALVQDKQREMRRVLFRHVDFSACSWALDFGCGFSTDVLMLAQQHSNLKLHGYTISAEQAEVGKRRMRENKVDDQAQVFNRDSAKDPFPGMYDVVFGFEVAHHIKDKAALFSNIGQHMNSGGRLVLADFISNVAFEIEHDESSSFFLTVAQWTELLSAQQLLIEDVVDCSRHISNFLHDPDFDKHLDQMRKAGEEETVLVGFQSYDRLGKMLDRGLASYILLSAKKVEGKSVDELRELNRAGLTNLLPYVAQESENTEDHQLLFGVEWKRSAPAAEARPGEGWLVVANREETTAPLAERLAEQGVRSVRVFAGSGFAQVGPDRYQMQLSAASFKRLLNEAFGHEKPCARAIFLNALDMPEVSGGVELCAAIIDLCSDATSLAQALVTHGFRTVPRLYLVTQGAQSVESSGAHRVAQAPLGGLGKTIALEHPELKCTRLDLDPTASIDPNVLLHEMSGADREDQVALRGGERFVARIVRAPATGGKKDGATIRGDRSYLITGGLGGLGLRLSRWLVEKGAGLVFLAGRKEPSGEARRAIGEMNQNGVRVIAVQADVSRGPDVAELLARIEQSGRPLSGVIHAAGVLRDKTLLEQTRETFHDVMLPKVLGAWNLHTQLKSDPLDFFVLYSSTAALCGSPGQANYCAANAFLDGLSQLRVQQGKKALSLQWGAFSEVGMAAAQDNRGKRVASMGFESLSPSEGHHMLEKLLGSELPTVGVMKLNARQWVEMNPSAAGLPFFSDLAKLSGAANRVGKAARKMLEKLRDAQESERQTLTVEHLAEQVGAVLQQEPNRLDPHAPFQNLGVDSLMSLEIRNRLEESLGVRLGATVLYTYATLSTLGAHLLESLGYGASAANKEKPQVAQQAPKATAHFEQLSDEDLARVGEDLLA